MKAKYLLLLILGVFYSIGIQAMEIEILIHHSDSKDKWPKSKRSITLEPTATIDGNTIRIYTNVTITDLHTSIKDSMGNIVYTYSDATPARCHTLELFNLTAGEYILEFSIGEESFYGYFIIE